MDENEQELLYDLDGNLIEEPNDVSMADEEELLGNKKDVVEKKTTHPVEQEAVKALENGAKRGAQMNKEQLEDRVKNLEKELARAHDLVEKRTRERNEAVAEHEKAKQTLFEKEKKADATAAKQRESRAALSAAFRGFNVNEARRKRAERDTGSLRFTVYPGTKLHPDYECREGSCGGERRLEDLFPRERLQMGRVGKVVFTSLRQLAALIDMRDEWPDLSIHRANTEMKERVDTKRISSRSTTKAYEEGICEHIIKETNAVDRIGVLIEGEDLAVSDAISSALVRKGGRQSRKSLLVMVPQDSVVAGCGGKMSEVELTIYENLQDLREKMKGMEKANNFPKSLFILIKSSLPRESIEELKAYLGEVTKEAEMTCYVSADMLPVKRSDIKTEAIKMHQEYLTLWSTEEIPVNLVVINSVSGMLWGAYPFVTLFGLARRESLEMFEKAVKYIVDGTPLPMEEVRDSCGGSSKRPAPSEWSGNASTSKKSNDDIACYNCHKMGHYASSCKEPKKKNVSRG